MLTAVSDGPGPGWPLLAGLRNPADMTFSRIRGFELSLSTMMPVTAEDRLAGFDGRRPVPSGGIADQWGRSRSFHSFCWRYRSPSSLRIAVRVIMRRAARGVALSWLLLVAALPLVGALVYLLIGERRIGRKRSLRHQGLADRFQGNRKGHDSVRVHLGELAGPSSGSAGDGPARAVADRRRHGSWQSFRALLRHSGDPRRHCARHRRGEHQRPDGVLYLE